MSLLVVPRQMIIKDYLFICIWFFFVELPSCENYIYVFISSDCGIPFQTKMNVLSIEEAASIFVRILLEVMSAHVTMATPFMRTSTTVKKVNIMKNIIIDRKTSDITYS